MSANVAPRFIDPGKVWVGQVTTANANLDGTGAVVTVVTAGSNGSLITQIVFKAAVTTTTGMLRIFIHDGSNYRLYAEVDQTAAIPAATVKSFTATFTPTEPLVLQSGYSLRFSTSNSEAVNVIVQGGDY